MDDRKPRPPRLDESELERFRIEVGRDHGVTPGHIVGAIANEAGLDSCNIGRIQLYDKHSTVDLPRGMPRPVLRHLQRVRIFQQPLAIQRDTGRQPECQPGDRRGQHDGPASDASAVPRKRRSHEGRPPGQPGGGKPKKFAKGKKVGGKLKGPKTKKKKGRDKGKPKRQPRGPA